MSQTPNVGAPERVPVVPYLAIPSADGKFTVPHILAVESFAERGFPKHIRRRQTCSLLAYCFNTLYADALNLRDEHGVTHFVMLHDDVGPMDPAPNLSWIRVMLSVMIAQDLGALSLLTAIKSDAGESSAAVDTTGDVMAPRRLRLEEFNERPLLTTREEPNLLVNTGCLAIDLTKDWSESVYFHVDDGIRKGADGKFSAFVDPEDWNLSRKLKAIGVPFGVTNTIRVHHTGSKTWANVPGRTTT